MKSIMLTTALQMETRSELNDKLGELDEIFFTPKCTLSVVFLSVPARIGM